MSFPFDAKLNSKGKLEFGVPYDVISKMLTDILESAPSPGSLQLSSAIPPVGDGILHLDDDLSWVAKTEEFQKQAERFVTRKEYTKAIAKFREVIDVIVGDDFKVPLDSSEGGGYKSEKYIRLDLLKRSTLMKCCNDIGECLVNLKRDVEAMDYFEEVDMLYRNMRLANNVPMFDWININLLSPEFVIQRGRGLVQASELFLKLGNTGAAVHRKYMASISIINLPDNDSARKAVLKMNPTNAMFRLLSTRHPDPRLSAKLEIKNPDLQIRGSWCKIEIPREKVIQPRYGFASFVWNGRYYVYGGEKYHTGPYFHDLHYLELSNMKAGWHKLPDYPLPDPNLWRCSGWQMFVYDNKAYLFAGRPRLDYVDLVEERWSSVQTKYSEGGWPYPNGSFMNYGAVILDSTIYVFGGTHSTSELGCNLLIALDLKDPSYTWHKLSGHAGQPDLRPDFNLPGPRRHPTIWLDDRVKGKERIYILYGEANRQGAKIHYEPYGAEESFGYEDFWSWDIHGKEWRRERLVGNAPSPRSESAYTFNKELGLTAVFGGYMPSVPTMRPEQQLQHSFTYYADTFVYIPPPLSDESSKKAVTTTSSLGPRWKQVITRGFPTYRAQSQLFTDPATGKMYLFGGYTNAQFIPDNRHEISRAFSDIWQLKLDIPGGYFEGVDLEEEKRTATAGPWKRCFNCGNAGPWRKCGGSCHGKAFFCEPQCLREGWKLHKEMHRCKKQ
ncbi:hypothetical protein K474DRAFT_1646268 [Panus rudis PR-1116 ss-1]|nr:hypothetical protein K474DRAFT_1646268 [Panus rudis PR-1116 ss-1]